MTQLLKKVNSKNADEVGDAIVKMVQDSGLPAFTMTFDNGKVIAEIQKQQSLPEEEARYVLSEYVQQIKDTLSQGNLHFFEGIGYLAKDAQGFYSIQETMSSTNLINEEEIQEPAALDINENSAKETLEEEQSTLQEKAFSAATIEALMQKGHELKIFTWRTGNMHSIIIDKKSGKLDAASDPRGEGQSIVAGD